MITAAGSPYTLGVLVQANFGGRNQLTIAGVPVGREIKGFDAKFDFACRRRPPLKRGGRGSIIAIVATDAPLVPHQLRRVALRIGLGVGRTGGTASNFSGDIFLAFSTANKGAAAREGVRSLVMLSNDEIDPVFDATVDATEEAIINAMVAAKTMTGINGNTIHAHSARSTARRAPQVRPSQRQIASKDITCVISVPVLSRHRCRCRIRSPARQLRPDTADPRLSGRCGGGPAAA